MLTGQRVAHSATTLYYSTYPEALLRRVYTAASVRLWGPRQAGTQDGPADLPPNGEERYVGSRQCPTDSAVKTLFAYLGAPLQKHDIAAFLEYHNQYTCYVVAAQTLGLGYRGRVSPAVDDRVVRTRLVTFTDKARSDYHRRVSYLPKVIRRLLDCYAEHRKVLRRRLGDGADIQPDGAVFAWWDEDRGKFRPFRPGDFEACSGAYGLPLRSLRHYMRTRLATGIIAGQIEDVSMETVDAWMGHWHVGLSPREAGSTFDPRLLLRLVDGPVAAVLADVGIVAFSSRYVDHVW